MSEQPDMLEYAAPKRKGRLTAKLGWKSTFAWIALGVLIAAITICAIAVIRSPHTFQVSD